MTLEEYYKQKNLNEQRINDAIDRTRNTLRGSPVCFQTPADPDLKSRIMASQRFVGTRE